MGGHTFEVKEDADIRQSGLGPDFILITRMPGERRIHAVKDSFSCHDRLAVAFFFGPTAGERVCAAVSLAGALAVCALGLDLSLRLQSGWLFAIAALGLLWGALGQLGLARGGKSV